MGDGRFEGQSIVVVGGASGVGLAAVKRALSEGARVAVLDRQLDGLAEVREVNDESSLLAVECDVTDAENVTAAVQQVLAWAPNVSRLLYTVGGIGGGPLDTVTLESWNRIHAINNTGVMLVAQALLPRFIESGNASIVTLSSVSAQVAGIGPCIAYKASKAALVQTTRTIAVDYAEQGIRANCILPGPIATGFGRGGRVAGDDELGVSGASLVPPMKRRAKPEEIAATALYLLSDDASYVTGVALPVDGGSLAI